MQKHPHVWGLKYILYCICMHVYCRWLIDMYLCLHMHSGSISYESITSRYQNTKNQYDKFLGTYNCYIPSLIPPKNGPSSMFSGPSRNAEHKHNRNKHRWVQNPGNESGMKYRISKMAGSNQGGNHVFSSFFFVGKHLVNNMCFTTYSSSLCFHCSCAWEAFHSEPTCCWIAIR